MEQIRVYRWVLLGGILAGMAVYAILIGPHLYWGTLFGSVLIGTIYAMVMMTIQRGVGSFAERRIPLRSARSAAALLAIQVTTMIASFVLATLVVRLLPFQDFEIEDNVLAVVLMVSVTASIIGHASLYLWRLYMRVREAEETALRSELQALRAQINPHFLFNSLNSIAALTRISPARAEEVTQALADLFRYALDSSARPLVTLAEELEAVRLYLSIEQARFGDRLEVDIDLPRELMSLRVPCLTLQPLVENGVKHGLGGVEGVCRITIRGKISGTSAVLHVSDTGPGFDVLDQEVLTRRGLGLSNVQSRLRHELGSGARLFIQRNTVEIHIPFKEARLESLTGSVGPWQRRLSAPPGRRS